MADIIEMLIALLGMLLLGAFVGTLFWSLCVDDAGEKISKEIESIAKIFKKR